MAAIDNKGDEKYWIEGLPFQGLRFEPAKPGSEKYWVNGLPEENLTPLQNFDTGKFFLLFE